MPYTLHESALYAILTADEAAVRRLVAQLEAMEANPIWYIHAESWGESGDHYNICFAGEFRIHFVIQEGGCVFIRDVLSR